MPLSAEEYEAFQRMPSVEKAKASVSNNRERLAELERLCDKLQFYSRISFAYQAEKAFLKYFDAIVNGVKIFISYKIGFAEAARSIIEPFELYGNGRICTSAPFPFMCERVSDAGKEFRLGIYKALEEAHWFFLLLPEQSLDRSWTLFEAGYFKRAMGIEDRLIAIHHSRVEMAGPLTDLDAVRAENDQISVFLRQLLREPDAIPGMAPINPLVPMAKVQSHAETIAAAIQPSKEIWRQYRIDYLDIRLAGGHAPANVAELLDAVVIDASGLEHIFGYAGRNKEIELRKILARAHGSVDFSQLSDEQIGQLIGREHIFWLKSIVDAIREAFEHRPHEPSDAIFTGEDDQFYRPTLLSIRRCVDTNEAESAHIAFLESATGPIRNCPIELSALGNVLRMGYRFKWEVLDGFHGIRTERDVNRVRKIIERMERESHQRGYYEPDRPLQSNLPDNPILAAFSDDTRPVIVEMFNEWGKLRNREGSGKLDLAFKEKNATATRECLWQIEKLNKDFMKIGTKRYAELVEEYWS